MMQKIHLDISEKTLSQVVYAKQFDVGRKFIVALYDSGAPYTIPESATLSVGYAAADGKNAGNFSGAVASENTIEITIDEIMTSTAGDGVLSVTLLHENGDEISTWNVPYSIEMQPGSFPVVPSPNTVNLTKAVLFSAQNLTDAQKAQARQNIGVTESGGGGTGADGKDGFSPIATVTQTANGAIISITDKDGTTTAEISDGEDGFSPIATVTQTDSGAIISITDKDGTTTATILNGEGGGGSGGDSVWTEDSVYKGCFYRLVSTKYGEQYEWLNPPMTLDALYRTAERYGGKPVYKMVLDLTAGDYAPEGYSGIVFLNWPEDTGEFSGPLDSYHVWANGIIDYSLEGFHIDFPDGPLTPEAYNWYFDSSEGYYLELHDNYSMDYDTECSTVSWSCRDSADRLYLTIAFTLTGAEGEMN